MRDYKALFLLGADETTDNKSLKKIKLFNAICYLWYVIDIALIIRQYVNIRTIDATIITHFTVLIVLIVAQYLHYKKYYAIAYGMYLMSLLTLIYVFANFVKVSSLTEYYYMFVPIVALLFTENKFIVYGFFIIALACFTIPSRIYNYYPDQGFTDIIQPFLFTGIFIMVKYFKDVNTRSEKNLEEKTQELAKLNQYQSQFFTNISHEIRTPLTLIKGSISELDTEDAQKKDLLRVKTSIADQLLKITKIVDDVLDLAKMDSSHFALNLKQHNLTALLKKLYASFEPLFKQKAIRFFLHPTYMDYIIQTDVTFLERALSNIIVNAQKYTPKNGRVDIQLIEHKTFIEVHITDTGIGISESDINKVYNRFYQVDNSINRAGGSGVGLSFSKEIIELHQGKLIIESELQKGSNFIVRLPIHKKSKTKHLKPSPIHENSTNIVNKDSNKTHDLNFLIVEDTYEMRKYLVKLLSKYYNCFEAENGAEGLEVMKTNKIDYIITDYMMPVMDGYDFIVEVKKQYSIPIIMLTARSDSQSKLNILRLGIDDYIVKPFEKEELLVRIKNALINYKNRADYTEIHQVNDDELKETDTFLKDIKVFVSDNCGKLPIDQDVIADTFNMSKSSLYRKIKIHSGMTPNAFITEVKLDKAKQLIEANKVNSLKHLALEVGFKNSSYFSKIYKDRFGVKPRIAQHI